ncbi:MAG: zinc metallopeptidase [Lacipirellulaceae bacterium]
MLAYLLFMAPAVLLALWAQRRVQSQYARASQVGANLTGAAAARLLLDSAGLTEVRVESIAGTLTDHYDPRAKVLRLSEGVYGHRTMAAVGIAAHEAGHALQDATNYAPLVIRNMAVPLANFGGSAGIMMIMAGGLLMSVSPLGVLLLVAGVVAFSMVAVFQLVNLPVEFDASNRAKRQLVEFGIVPANGMQHVNGVLDAAAWTYVAGTAQSVMMVLYYVSQLAGSSSRE